MAFNKKTASYLAGNLMLKHKKLDRIKKLYIFGIKRVSQLLRELDHLKQLEILKIENCHYLHPFIGFRDEFKIELPNLCSLKIKNCFPMFRQRLFHPRPYLRHCFITIKWAHFVCRIRSPNLAYCVLPNFDQAAHMQLECFEKVRYIKCDSFDEETAKKTVNLETLVCKQLQSLRLDELPKLKKIVLFPHVESKDDEEYDLTQPYNFEAVLKSLREQKANLVRSDLQIVVNGFEDGCESIGESLDLNAAISSDSDSDRMADDHHICFTKANAGRIAENYGKLVQPLSFRTKVNYTNLIGVFNSQIPMDFFEKFPEIVRVSVSGPVDNASDVLEFLKNCADLQCLKLKNCQCEQQFYLDLIRFQSLSCLVVEERRSSQIDFSFVPQFKNLIYFELRSDLMPLDVVYQFFTRLPRLPRFFAFNKLNSDIEISIQNRRYIFSNWLNINGKRVFFEPTPEIETQTMDNLFLFLKNHKYRKFFI